ncbi:MAG: helical backbone metal receptor [Thermodesulfobacteriota bacterium]
MRLPSLLLLLLLTAAAPTCQALETSTFPQRLISLGPINTENVFLLGAGERLVANTRYCVRPEAARAREKIGSMLQVSVEKIISLQPDLVLATAMTRPEQIRQLRAVGIRVEQFDQPASFRQICDHFRRLGQLLGLEEEAKKIIRQAKAQVAAVRQQVAGLPPQKVFLQVGSQPLFGSVPSSFTHDFIKLAGGTNIIADQTLGTTSREKIIAKNPHVIIIAIMGSESGIAAQERRKWLAIPVIAAVRQQRVHIINPNQACSPSPATFAQTLTEIADLIHPQGAAKNRGR